MKESTSARDAPWSHAKTHEICPLEVVMKLLQLPLVVHCAVYIVMITPVHCTVRDKTFQMFVEVGLFLK